MIKVLFDMETSDPDDVAALCFLCYHRAFDLRAVTITPGTLEQVGLVREVLRRCGKGNASGEGDLPIGSRKPNEGKPGSVSGFFRKHFPINPMAPQGFGHEIIHEFFKENPDGVLFTGAALHNPREALQTYDDFEIGRWVGQGGFAGDSVVPEEFRLEKFKGLETCPTFNFNGDRKGADLMLSSPRVRKRQLVSKNVCHGMCYDKSMHAYIVCPNECPARSTFIDLMTKYLEDHPGGKLFHDPLAAATIIKPDICSFEEVEVYYEKGGWGSRKKAGTDTVISVNADRDKFIKILQGFE